MTFKKGSQFWKMRATHGPKLIFDDPNKLYEACVEYFEWVEDNPLRSEKVGFSQGDTCRAEIEHIRAMTSSGLSAFLGITHKTLIQWKKERDDLSPVIEWAEGIIWEQKFSGAAAGLLNAQIISRELGLADKQIHDIIAPTMIVNPPDGETPPAPPIHGE